MEACGRQCFQEEEVVSCPILLRHQGGQEPRVLGKFAAWVLVSLTSAASAWWGWAKRGDSDGLFWKSDCSTDSESRVCEWDVASGGFCFMLGKVNI